MGEDNGTAPPLMLPATSVAPRLARKHLTAVGAAWSADVRDLALLLTSELVTNAVRYGNGTVCLTVEQTGERIRIAVRDGNPAAPSRSGADRTAERGRGLHLLDRLASRWGCTPSSGPVGKIVWFELDPPVPAGA